MEFQGRGRLESGWWGVDRTSTQIVNQSVFESRLTAADAWATLREVNPHCGSDEYEDGDAEQAVARGSCIAMAEAVVLSTIDSISRGSRRSAQFVDSYGLSSFFEACNASFQARCGGQVADGR